MPPYVYVRDRRPTEPATVENPRLGFTDEEQADRVENFLRTIGLVSDYAPFVIMMGHGSSSQNNPHMAAYDCGDQHQAKDDERDKQNMAEKQQVCRQ